MASSASSHTILLAQFGVKANTRQYSDFESLSDAMDGVCRMFETKLKQSHPDQRKITYDISDLFAYIDQLPDLTCLVYDGTLGAQGAYVPHNKKWIKDKVFEHLKRQAGGA